MEAAPRRIGVLGSSKTVHRYAERLRRAGADARAVEVLQFQPNAPAVAQAVALIRESQRAAADKQPGGTRLQLILTSSVAVEILHEALEAAAAAEHPRVTYDPMRTAVLTVKGCGTANACGACPAFGNVTFCGSQLRDIYAHLETQRHLHGRVRTVVVGVATGGDRSYRTSPTLSKWIEEIGVYESVEVPDATALVGQTLSWIEAAGGDLMVTSSKSATVLARAINLQLQSNGRYQEDIRLVAQGPSTAATLRCALGRRAPEGGGQVQILTPAAPNIEAITELLCLEHDRPKVVASAQPTTERLATKYAGTPADLFSQPGGQPGGAAVEYAAKTEEHSMLYAIGVFGFSLVVVAILFSVLQRIMIYPADSEAR